MDITIILITIAICYVLLKLSNRKTTTRSKITRTPQKRQRKQENPETLFAWPALNEFEFEVVGESYYQSALASLASEHPDSDSFSEAAKPLTAYLIPDDFNQYDDKAVRVEINGLHIGYLSREDARSFRRRLGAKKLTGQTTICGALITGGHVVDGKKMHYGAILDLKPFELAIPRGLATGSIIVSVFLKPA